MAQTVLVDHAKRDAPLFFGHHKIKTVVKREREFEETKNTRADPLPLFVDIVLGSPQDCLLEWVDVADLQEETRLSRFQSQKAIFFGAKN
jgi:hypothetical protein